MNLVSFRLTFFFIKRQVYILGCAGIRDELDAMNIQNFGVGPDPLPDNCQDLVPAVNTDERVDGVIVGYDNVVSLPKLVKVSPTSDPVHPDLTSLCD